MAHDRIDCIVSAGYVADMYMQALPAHDLQLAGAYDRDPARLAAFCAYHRAPAYPSLDALLADERVGIVVNLTTPHYRPGGTFIRKSRWQPR